eukprot:8220678-Pyramimonas_sp.AAC.1
MGAQADYQPTDKGEVERIERVWQRLNINHSLIVHERRSHEEAGEVACGATRFSSHDGAAHPEGDEGADCAVLAEAVDPVEAAPSEPDPESDS